MLKTLLTGLMLVLTARVSLAQDFGIAYTSTDLDWDEQSNTIEASCTIFLDYTAEVYYETATNCYIYHDSNVPAHIVANDWGYGTNYANVNLEYNYPTQDTTYSTQATFFVTMPYYYYDAGDFYYYDPYDYLFYEYAGIFAPLWYDFYGYDEPTYRVNYETLFLGYLYDSETTAPGPADHVKKVGEVHGFPPDCPTTGIRVRQLQVQLVDSSGVAINNNASVVEAYDQQPTNTCTNQQIPAPSSCQATGDGGTGQFIDTMAVSLDLCGSGISQSSTCGFSLTSTWSACSGGRSNQLWQSSRTTHANLVTIDGNTTTFPSGAEFH
jgi:hypothetical protein